MGKAIQDSCRHIPGSSCCTGEMEKRKCPLLLNRDCVGRTGGIGADMEAAQAAIKLYPERRTPKSHQVLTNFLTERRGIPNLLAA